MCQLEIKLLPYLPEKLEGPDNGLSMISLWVTPILNEIISSLENLPCPKDQVPSSVELVEDSTGVHFLRIFIGYLNLDVNQARCILKTFKEKISETPLAGSTQCAYQKF